MNRKFEVGEHLVYGLHGVCRLEEITVDGASGETTYVLQPLGDKRCRLFIPCGNEICLSKMRKVLSREEAEALILEMPHMEENWISQESQRKMVFADILKRGDRREIAQLIKTISLTEIRLKEKGKRLYRVDEKTMKDAKKILYGEFAHVLGMKFEDVEPYVLEKIQVA